jgi:hypothetical protein
MGDVNSISQQDADRRMESKRLRLIDPKPALSMISVLTAQRIFQSSHLLQFSFSISQLPRLRGAASKQRAPAADEQTSPVHRGAAAASTGIRVYLLYWKYCTYTSGQYWLVAAARSSSTTQVVL